MIYPLIPYTLSASDDELEIEDFAWDDTKKVFHYPCPCGDRFEITRVRVFATTKLPSVGRAHPHSPRLFLTQAQLSKGEDVATCPSCSLIVRVVYDMMDYEDYSGDEEV
ncbi:BQ5605_C002g01787 [Microbotryum silenes-dioicae]|uniref:Diphthamide biosynthesis protein 3 n=1 Tax=Microbotryum silenes-dioicae TaxID=796604 RepID=A0A2X0MUJ0_9BASI|nr:BQ5605_C002g01787 [Microbotryum silenes-dioicae]